jgi:uncharacterized protein with HEPN domain
MWNASCRLYRRHDVRAVSRESARVRQIEWSKAAAFRDVIAHHYFGLDARIVWDVVQTKIPDIVSLAGAVLEEHRK